MIAALYVETNGVYYGLATVSCAAGYMARILREIGE